MIHAFHLACKSVWSVLIYYWLFLNRFLYILRGFYVETYYYLFFSCTSHNEINTRDSNKPLSSLEDVTLPWICSYDWTKCSWQNTYRHTGVMLIIAILLQSKHVHLWFSYKKTLEAAHARQKLLLLPFQLTSFQRQFLSIWLSLFLCSNL